MNRLLPWIVAVGCAGWAVFATYGPGRIGAHPAPAVGRPLPIQTLLPPEGTVAYTFESSDELDRFESLWTQRDKAAARMRVLQTYWEVEQRAIDRIATELRTTYALDPAKRYQLDAEQRALLELPPGTEASPTTAEDGAAPDAQADPTVAHTFESEDAMQAFGNLWLQQQQAAARMNALQAYWNLEQSAVHQINVQLAEQFHIDPTKDYAVNQQQITLIELDAPDTASVNE